MNRRDFFALTGAAAVTMPMPAWAKALDYTDGLVKRHLAKGETVFLDFRTDWCTTCAAQERVINALKKSNPDYEKSITFINVDWDQHSRSALAKDLNIPRRSTLVVLRGNDELGRIVAGTSKKEIKALMDTALSAATA